MSRFLKKLKDEVINAIPAIIYFLIIFNLLHFISNLAHQPGDIKVFGYWTMTLAALIVGKVIVLVNCFSFINAFPHKPIVYNVIWKVFVYNVLILLLVICHILIHLTLKYHDFKAATARLIWDLGLPFSWSIVILLVLTFVGYVLFSEFVRVLGKDKMKQLLFGSSGEM